MADLARTWADSYRTRLALGYLLVVALLASAWAWSLFGPLNEAVVGHQQGNLRAVAQAGALVLAETDTPASVAVDQLTARTDLRMTIVAADGTVLADSMEDPASMENHGDRPEIVTALEGGVGLDRRVSETLDVEQLYVAVPSSLDGQRVALRVSESLERINAVAASARRFGLLLLLAAVVLAIALVARMTARASEPVLRLSDAAHAMARGNLSAPVPEESGELLTLSSALNDLRDQMKHRLDDLEAEQRNLRTVLDGLTDAVFLLHGTKVRFANRAAGTLFDAPAGGWRSRDLDGSGLPESVTAAIHERLDAEEPDSTECGPDTLGRYLRVLVVPLNPGPNHARSLVVVSDITERIRVDQVRRDFVANASHELKTPTAAIHLLAESAADAAADGDTAQAVEFARQIASESARLTRLVQDLLDLSRLEATPAPGTLTHVRTAITNALAGHRSAAARRGLELRLEDEALRGRDVTVAADPTDIAVALDNLLDNAVKYTESGSVTVGVDLDDETVRIRVADTGIGIPPSDLARVFERFYRVDRARSRDSGGTGLGLALVRHVVERSNGSVEVSSAEGEGSTFTITLRRG